MVLISDGIQIKIIDAWVGKANIVLCELYHSVVIKSFQTMQICQFLNWSLFWSSPMVMNLGKCLKQCDLMCKWQIQDFSKVFMAWHFATKYADVKFTKPYFELFLWVERSQLCWFSQVPIISMVRLVRKVLLASPTEKWPKRLTKDQVECLYLWPHLVWSWCGASRIIRDCQNLVEFWVLLGLLPSTLLKVKEDMKMNEPFFMILFSKII